MEQVIEYFSQLFSAEGFAPRWLCGHWTSFHGWLYVLSDIGIWGAYFTIPLLLLNFVSRRRDMPFPRIFWLFALFIFACGSTHLMDAIMFWYPAYRLSGLVFLATAIVSWITIFALVPVIPQALSLKSPLELEKTVAERTAELQDANRRYQLVLQGSNDGIWDWDIANNKTYASDRYYEILGIPRMSESEFSLEIFLNLVHPDDRDFVRENLQAHFQNPSQKFEVEFRLKHADGHYRYCISKGEALLNEEGKPTRMAGILADFTERKQLELQLEEAKNQAVAANQRKSQFLATMSHELRTPLNAIIGYSEMMDNGVGGPINDKQRKYTQNIIVSGRHLLDMVNDILDVAKIEAGKLTINPEWIDLQDFIRNIRSLMEPIAVSKQVSLIFSLDPGLSGLEADPTRLRQVFLNLISNAIKFNKEGGKVTVSLYRTDEPTDYLCCKIEDTGIGIPENKMKELFTDFFQVDPSFARQHEGTGLGLALTKRLVDHFHGSITVTSRESEGTTFIVKLPLHPVPSPAVAI